MLEGIGEVLQIVCEVFVETLEKKQKFNAT
jgi:hypothetical protein